MKSMRLRMKVSAIILFASAPVLLFAPLLVKPNMSGLRKAEEIFLHGSGESSTHLVGNVEGVELELFTEVPGPIYLKDADTRRWALEAPGELKIHSILRNVYSSLNLPSAFRDGVFVNVGAHECFFCLFAALYDQRVLAFEPLPRCIQDIRESISAYPKSVRAKIRLFHNYVSDVRFSLDTPSYPGSCVGTFSTNLSPEGPELSTENVRSVAIDDLLALMPKGVSAMAIDAEGSELHVLSSALTLFSRRKVYNLFVEYTPMWWRERTKFSLQSATNLLQTIIQAQNYRCYLLNETNYHLGAAVDISHRIDHILRSDWFVNSTLEQTDLYCTRCKVWLKTPAVYSLHKHTALELCDEWQ